MYEATVEGRPSAGGAPKVKEELKEIAVLGLPLKQAVKNMLTVLSKHGQVKAELLLHSMLMGYNEHYVVIRFTVDETIIVDALLTVSNGRVAEVDYDVYEYNLSEMLRRTAALKTILG